MPTWSRSPATARPWSTRSTSLLGAALSAATKASIRTAVDAIAIGSANGAQNRVYTAVLLTLAAPEYLVQK